MIGKLFYPKSYREWSCFVDNILVRVKDVFTY